MLNSMILNVVVLDSVNKSAPTQLVRTTVPVAVTTTLLMTYTTAWVRSKFSYLTESSHTTILSSVLGIKLRAFLDDKTYACASSKPHLQALKNKNRNTNNISVSYEKETDVNKGALVLQSVVVIKIKIPAAMDIVLFTTSPVSQY